MLADIEKKLTNLTRLSSKTSLTCPDLKFILSEKYRTPKYFVGNVIKLESSSIFPTKYFSKKKKIISNVPITKPIHFGNDIFQPFVFPTKYFSKKLRFQAISFEPVCTNKTQLLAYQWRSTVLTRDSPFLPFVFCDPQNALWTANG